MFDDVPVATLAITSAPYVQGATPAHLQAEHARITRTRLAPQEPESVQRAGPARINIADTPSPQTYPQLANTDHIDVDAALGLERADRPAQTPMAGWDGEMDAFAPDWTHPTSW